jgi:hypothetical protein
MSSSMRMAVNAMSVAMGCASRHFTPTRPQLLLMRRLARPNGRAAGTELLCLAARVFELGAGVGVDELASLDPLEAVTL